LGDDYTATHETRDRGWRDNARRQLRRWEIGGGEIEEDERCNERVRKTKF